VDSVAAGVGSCSLWRGRLLPAGGRAAGHFSTAAQGVPQIGEQLARALLTLMDQEGLDTFVDMGCGRGELLEQVHRLGPQVRCVGVDIVARPQLSEPIGWLQSPAGSSFRTSSTA